MLELIRHWSGSGFVQQKSVASQQKSQVVFCDSVVDCCQDFSSCLKSSHCFASLLREKITKNGIINNGGNRFLSNQIWLYREKCLLFEWFILFWLYNLIIILISIFKLVFAFIGNICFENTNWKKGILYFKLSVIINHIVLKRFI